MTAAIFKAEQFAAPLEQALSAVLETMFYCPIERFCLGDTLPGELAAAGGARLAELRFEGPSQGYFQLACSSQASALLAENFHGEVADAESVDAVVAELANMVCGNFLSQLHAEAVFRLSCPTLSDWRPRAGFGIWAELEGGWIWFSLVPDGESSAGAEDSR